MHLRSSAAFGRSVHCLWREPDAPERFSSAVSLHGHTVHSREGLEFIPRVLRRVEPAWAILRALEQRHECHKGYGVPYSQAYWRPPLPPVAAHRLEADNIRGRLGLNPLISLTDHDDIEASAELHATGVEAPCSLEWSVPFEGTMFHLGIHNLPTSSARELHARMARVTANPLPESVVRMLSELNGLPQTLIVLNHPLSNEEFTGFKLHFRMLYRFLREHRASLHALELNGLQPPRNNRHVTRIAAELGMPLVSGGDRHCLEPGAVVNLTNAGTFRDFVDEVRREGVSTVLFMPEYRDPIPCRYIRFIAEAVRTYPEFAGRERWVDRVFLSQEDGDAPLSAWWQSGGPWVVRSFVSIVRLLASRRVQGALRLAFGSQGEVGA